MFHDVFSGCVTTDSVEAGRPGLVGVVVGVGGCSWGTLSDPVSRKIRSVSRASGSPNAWRELSGSTKGVLSTGSGEALSVLTR